MHTGSCTHSLLWEINDADSADWGVSVKYASHGAKYW